MRAWPFPAAPRLQPRSQTAPRRASPPPSWDSWTYVNLDLRLIRIDKTKLLVEAFGPEGYEGLEVHELPEGLCQCVKGPRGRYRDVRPRRNWKTDSKDEEALLQTIGKLLVGSESVRDCYKQCTNNARRTPKVGVRLRLFIYDPVIAAIPWETAFADGNYIGRSDRFPVVRYVLGEGSTQFAKIPRPLRLLGVGCQPKKTLKLKVDEEIEKIKKALSGVDPKLLTCYWCPNPSATALHNRLSHKDIDIFHFIGHEGFDEAAREGSLSLVENDGSKQEVKVNDLITILQDTGVQFAFLNACETGQQVGGLAQELVHRLLPAAIGMRLSVRDDVAIEFAARFYHYLGESRPIDAALSAARAELSLDSALKAQWGLPILYMRASDGTIFGTFSDAADRRGQFHPWT